jgi:hypothetical protein
MKVMEKRTPQEIQEDVMNPGTADGNHCEEVPFRSFLSYCAGLHSLKR